VITGFAVRRWQFTVVAFSALAVLGWRALREMPKAEDPSFPLLNYSVVAVLPGAAPGDLERSVVDPLETKLKELTQIKHMASEIAEGIAICYLEFRPGVESQRKLDELQRAVTSIRSELPADLVKLEVEQFDLADVNVMEAAIVSSGASNEAMGTVARELRRELESVPGVRKVQLTGLAKTEVLVQLDPDKMLARSISPAEVISSIDADSRDVPIGSVQEDARQFNVKASGDFESIDEVAQATVRMRASSALRVGDVANVRRARVESAERARFDGEPAVLITASLLPDHDLMRMREGVERVLANFQDRVPLDMSLRSGFDQSVHVGERLGDFTRDFGLAVLLVLVTLVPLGMRASLVVMVAIPLSLAVGLIALHVTGYSINQLSTVGFVISLGLLVDDSVVVVENISRHLREGAKPIDAAIAGTRQMTASVVGCTATLCVAFVPLLALPGGPGQFIRSLPMAVLFTIFGSLLVSLTLVPLLSSALLRSEGEHGNLIFRALTSAIEKVYRPTLRVALRQRGLTLTMALLPVAGSLALVPRIGFSLFPKAGVPQFLVHIDAVEGASSAETDRAARFVERALGEHREITNVATVIGKSHPQIYYNVLANGERVNLAEVFAQLDVKDERARARVIAALRAKFGHYAGAKIQLTEFSNGPNIDAPVAIRLLGGSQDALSEAAARVEDVMLTMPELRETNNPMRERRMDLRFAIDRDRAVLLGVAVPEIDRALRLAVSGVIAGKYRAEDGEEAWPIRVTLAREQGPEQYLPSLEVVQGVRIANVSGEMVPLSMLGKFEFDPSPATIRHYNRETAVTLTAHVRDGYNTDRAARDVLRRAELLALPHGVRVEPAGELESRRDTTGELWFAVLAAAFGVTAILVLEFRTFRSTLVVASVVPLGLVGGLIALYLSGYTLSFTANIGFIALIGIEIKNSILLVDFTNELCNQGLDLERAIIRAGEVRFVPILLTSLTAIGGLIPLILDRSALYSPIAVVLLGGLVSSTLLTRVITPVLYHLLTATRAAEPTDSAGEPDRAPRTHPPVASQLPLSSFRVTQALWRVRDPADRR
jgi:multidrug efflux pump subunit AcrB